MPQDQTYCLNYLIARKFLTRISHDKILLLFQTILTSFTKRDAFIGMEMMPNCSARYELIFRVSFISRTRTQNVRCIDFQSSVYFSLPGN